ncbi:MAG: hypothetical protein HY758_00175 [Nitrospirae bacterium]|nr:hypothetical protein [Nitrospirota bacterium]
MNVTALGMGGVFASSFFIVLSMIGEVSCKFPLMKPLRYSLYFIFILFILNNGLIFKDQYTSSDSVYGKYISLRRSIGIYVAFYPYFIKYNLKEQGTHLFNTLVSNGLVDAASGKLIMERIKYLYPEIVRNTCKTESELQDFQPFDNKIYPITN